MPTPALIFDKKALRRFNYSKNGNTGRCVYATGRRFSEDPAMGDYIPSVPVNDEARRRNGNLPGMGGVFNYVNLHAYHYAGNNPVRYTDPDGRETGLARQLFEETSEIVEQIPPNFGPIVLTEIAKWGGWGIIGLFLMSLQGDSVSPALPVNYVRTSNGIIASNGALIATVDQAWKHARGSGDWNKIEGWSAGSHDSANDSLLAHFKRHGVEVGAHTPEQYLNKAKNFAKNLKGTRNAGPVPGYTNDVTRYIKNGKYIDLDPDKNIVSFGSINHVD